MIDPQEFRNAGFNEAQTALLLRAFERVDRASAQRFTVLQDTLNDTTVRSDQRFDRLEHALAELAHVTAQFVTETERNFGRMDGQFQDLRDQLDRVEQLLIRVDERVGGIERRYQAPPGAI
jgi:hypothetical protein